VCTLEPGDGTDSHFDEGERSTIVLVLIEFGRERGRERGSKGERVIDSTPVVIVTREDEDGSSERGEERRLGGAQDVGVGETPAGPK
jgi:hypothetical protein